MITFAQLLGRTTFISMTQRSFLRGNKLNFFHGLFSMATTLMDRGSGELKTNVAISVRKVCVTCLLCVCMCVHVRVYELSSFFKENQITRTRSFQRYWRFFFRKKATFLPRPLLRGRHCYGWRENLNKRNRNFTKNLYYVSSVCACVINFQRESDLSD